MREQLQCRFIRSLEDVLRLNEHTKSSSEKKVEGIDTRLNGVSFSDASLKRERRK